MTAVYPAQVKVFVPHTDQKETILAAHVNALQEEMAAVQTVLGTGPQIDATLNQQYTNYGTVRQRLETIQRGSDRPVCRVQRWQSQQALPNLTYTNIAWDTTGQIDPFNMFSSGTDIICQRTGWYTVSGNVNYAPNATGQRQFVLTIGLGKPGSVNDTTTDPWQSGNNGQPFSAAWGTLLNLGWAGKITKGQVVRLAAWQSSGGTLGVNADLELTFIRDI